MRGHLPQDSSHDANLLKKQHAEWFPRSPFRNLDAGATSHTPNPVLEVVETWRRKIATDPVGVIWGEILHAIEESRTVLARFLASDEKRLLLFANTTLAINTVVQTSGWKEGDEVVLTDLEYHHYYPLWQRTARRFGLVLKTAVMPLGEEATPENIAERIFAQVTKRTRMIFCSHVTSTTGLVLPVRAITEEARRRGITTLIDGAHAPGLVPLDFSQWRPDFYAGNVHKWLMGPVGSAFLQVADHARFAFEPLIGTESLDYDKDKADEWLHPRMPPTAWIRSFEYQGTTDRSAQAAIAKALSLRAELGEANVRRHTTMLRAKVRDHIERRGLKCLSSDHPELASAMVTWVMKQKDRIRAWMWMRDQGFQVGVPVWRGNEAIMRVSCAWFVDSDWIDEFFAVYDRMPMD